MESRQVTCKKPEPLMSLQRKNNRNALWDIIDLFCNWTELKQSSREKRWTVNGHPRRSIACNRLKSVLLNKKSSVYWICYCCFVKKSRQNDEKRGKIKLSVLKIIFFIGWKIRTCCYTFTTNFKMRLVNFFQQDIYV